MIRPGAGTSPTWRQYGQVHYLRIADQQDRIWSNGVVTSTAGVLPSRPGVDGPFIGFRWAHAGSAYPFLSEHFFRGTLFLESVVFLVGELSYHAARVTSREDSIGNVACDHAARADDRP